MTLGEALERNWPITLQCDRRRAGLKSTRPCMQKVTLDLASVVAALGPFVRLDELASKLRCPSCGTENIILHMSTPPVEPPKAEPGGPGRRQMRGIRAGEEHLGQYAEPWIVVHCRQCGRRGEYRRETLLKQFGPDIRMTLLHPRIAAWRGCALAQRALDKPDLTVAFPCKIAYDIETPVPDARPQRRSFG